MVEQPHLVCNKENLNESNTILRFLQATYEVHLALTSNCYSKDLAKVNLKYSSKASFDYSTEFNLLS